MWWREGEGFSEYTASVVALDLSTGKVQVCFDSNGTYSLDIRSDGALGLDVISWTQHDVKVLCSKSDTAAGEEPAEFVWQLAGVKLNKRAKIAEDVSKHLKKMKARMREFG